MVIAKQYTEVNGTYYYEGTEKKVIDWLETARSRNERIRLFYGNKETGFDWMEEHDTIGTVSRSCGDIKIPLLIKNSRSHGGSAILTENIVKITVGKRVVYQHPKYYQPELFLMYHDLTNRWAVQTADDVLATFEDYGKAYRWSEFIKGHRNSK